MHQRKLRSVSTRVFLLKCPALILSLLLTSASCSSFVAPDEEDYTSGVSIRLVPDCENACPGSLVEYGTFDGPCPSEPDGVVRVASLLAHSARSKQRRRSTPGSALLLDNLKQASSVYVLYRTDACAVAGFGCGRVPSESGGSLELAVEAFAGELGACRAGACACPAPPPDYTGSGACALQVVAAGQLPGSTSVASRVAGPAIAATAAGFVIAYRQKLETDTSSGLKTWLLSDDGEIRASSELELTDFESSCSESWSDGLGIAYDDSSQFGLVALTRPSCGQPIGFGALLTVGLDARGDVTTATSRSTSSTLRLSPIHALSGGRTRNDFRLAYIADGVAHLLRLRHDATDDAVAEVLRSGSRFTGVGQSAGGVALLLGTTAGPTLLYFRDEQSPVPTELSPAAHGGLAAWAAGAVGVVPGRLSVDWATRDSAGTGTSSGSLPTSVGVLSADATVVGDFIVALAGSVEGLHLFRLDGAFAGPSFVKDSGIVLGSANVPLLFDLARGFDGKQLSAASARGKVAFVFPYSASADRGRALVGWAIVSCR